MEIVENLEASAAMVLQRAAAAGLDGSGAKRSDAIALADAAAFPLAAVMAAAAAARDARVGIEVHLCGIINARSGACAADCRYCAQSAHARTDAPLHALVPPERIAAEASRLAGEGVHCFGIITSGPAATDSEVADIAAALRSIRSAHPGLDVSVSLGMQSEDNLRVLRDAGMTRYHHNLETSRNFFPNVCTTHSWDGRLATLERTKALGIELCSGGLFGLGEDWNDRVDLALELRRLGVSSVPINFLTPIPGTPMESRPVMTADEALRLIAIYRLLLPDATLRICGGRPVVLGERQAEIFAAGANAMMTGNYLTVKGLEPDHDLRLVAEAGMRPRLAV